LNVEGSCFDRRALLDPDTDSDPDPRPRRRDDLATGVAAANAFGYNLRSEVTSAAMGTNAYAYEYDPISPSGVSAGMTSSVAMAITGVTSRCISGVRNAD
jgi:hypothetical protein